MGHPYRRLGRSLLSRKHRPGPGSPGLAVLCFLVPI
jgi:hypothetical protein